MKTKLNSVILRALLLPIAPLFGLAEPGVGGAIEPPAGTPTPPVSLPSGSEPPAGGTKDPQAQPRMFTQEEVTRMMTAEKNQGRRSVLAELGITDEGKSSEAIAAYKAWADSQKTELEKQQGLTQAAEAAKAAAEQQLVTLNYKVAALGLGVKAEHIDDIVLLASTRVTATKPFDKVLAELKANAAYASFFGDSTTSAKPVLTGTGTNIGGSKGAPGGELQTAAQRLAAAREALPKKSSYFSTTG